LLEAVGSLDGEQLVAGQTLLQAIRTQFELLRLARTEPEAEDFRPVPVRDDYTLEQFLDLRHDAAELENRLSVPRLRVEELRCNTRPRTRTRRNACCWACD